MNQQSIGLIRESFDKLVPIADEVEARFSARLFDTYPDVCRIFLMDVAPQERALVRTLERALGRLAESGGFPAAVDELARRHHAFRIAHVYYDALATTLLWTLRHSLGGGFTREVELAWAEALHPRAAGNSVASGKTGKAGAKAGRPKLVCITGGGTAQTAKHHPKG